MAQETTIEERLAALEKEVAQLKQQLEQIIRSVNWLDRVAGSMKDIPESEFAEFVRLGREIRQADRPADES